MAYPDDSIACIDARTGLSDREHGVPPLFRGFGSHASRRGLTLIELLVVIVIIGILASLAVTVMSKVTQGGKVAITQDALKVGDQALNSYVQQKETIPPPVFEDPRDPGRGFLIPVADARNMSPGLPASEMTIINSVGLFIYQAENDAGLTGLFSGVDTKILRRFDADSTDPVYLNGGELDPKFDQMAPPASPGGPSGRPQMTNQPFIPTLMDGFGRPIRYVHPAFGGIITGPDRGNPTNPSAGLAVNRDDMLRQWTRNNALTFSFPTIRRNKEITAPGGGPIAREDHNADSDGGRPTANRPYFYSAGASGNPGDLSDNIYTGGSKPEFDYKN